MIMNSNPYPSIPHKSVSGRLRLLFVSAILLPGISVAAQSQPRYSLALSRMAGGGGTSANGRYSLSGTIGQYDASGPMIGGAFTLNGGLWAPFSVQTIGTPLLRIFRTGPNTAVVAWPASSTAWTLEQCSNPAAPNWSPAGGTLNVVGNENQVSFPSTTGNRFFRLAHP